MFWLIRDFREVLDELFTMMLSIYLQLNELIRNPKFKPTLKMEPFPVKVFFFGYLFIFKRNFIDVKVDWHKWKLDRSKLTFTHLIKHILNVSSSLNCITLNSSSESHIRICTGKELHHNCSTMIIMKKNGGMLIELIIKGNNLALKVSLMRSRLAIIET